jgi:hypothetical protein
MEKTLCEVKVMISFYIVIVYKMINDVHAFLQPDLHRGYCDYFYFLMVIYLIIGILIIADFLLSGIQNIKTFSSFMMNHMGSKIIHLLSIILQFFVVRLLYSMCYRSLHVQEGMRRNPLLPRERNSSSYSGPTKKQLEERRERELRERNKEPEYTRPYTTREPRKVEAK